MKIYYTLICVLLISILYTSIGSAIDYSLSVNQTGPQNNTFTANTSIRFNSTIAVNFINSSQVYDPFISGVNNTLWSNVTTNSGGPTYSYTATGGSMSYNCQFVSGNAACGFDHTSILLPNINNIQQLSMTAAFTYSESNTASGSESFSIFGQTIVSFSASDSFSKDNTFNVILRRNNTKFDMYLNNTYVTTFAPSNSNITYSGAVSGGGGTSGHITFGYSAVNYTLVQNYNFSNATVNVFYSNGTLFNRTTINITGVAFNTTNPSPNIFSNATSILVSNFRIGSYIWYMSGCATNGTSALCSDSSNFSLIQGITVNSNTYNLTTTNLATEMFITNLTVPNTVSISSVNLIWNNTNYTANFGSDGTNYILSRTIVIPGGLSGMINWSWSINFNESTQINLSKNPQTVNAFSIDDCTSFNNLILNYTMKDEDTQAQIPISENISIKLEVIISSLIDPSQFSIFNKSYNTTSAIVCVQNLNSTYRMDATAQYSSRDRVSEYFNTRNATLSVSTAPFRINLFDLATTRSQSCLITYKDSTFLPVKDAVISIDRKYISDGLFKTVEAPITDINGQTIAHLVTEDEVYNLVVKKENQLLAVFNNTLAIVQDPVTNTCTINLNEFQGGLFLQNIQNRNNLQYNFMFSQTTRTLTVFFSTLDGSVANVGLNVTRFSGSNNGTICASTTLGSSGTLICNVPQAYGNNSILAELYNNGKFVDRAYYGLKQNGKDVFGSTGGMLYLILYLTIPLMFIGDRIGMILGGVIGVITAVAINIINGGALIGIGASALWFIIYGAILIFKIGGSRR